MGLVILTRSPKFSFFSKESAKNIGRVLFKKTRGPQAVTESLLRGFNDLHYEYKLNPKKNNIAKDDAVYVNGSVEALKFAINLKKLGWIKKLIVGPAIVVTPNDYNGIAKDRNIDIYLVPSQWTKDFYCSFGPDEFANKIKIWAAGVNLPAESNAANRVLCLVFRKNVKDDLFDNAIRELKRKNIQTKIIYYGEFKRDEYFKLLEMALFMIYLQDVESQGIALLEAWARNVPTMVWNSGKFTYKKINKTVYGNISAPYLNDECGIFFEENNFQEKLSYFTDNLDKFNPRSYVEKNFTDRICAQKFLNLIN